MKCWPFLVLVLISAALGTSAVPQQTYCPEPPEDRSLYRLDKIEGEDGSPLVEGTVLRYRCGAGQASSGPVSVWNVTCKETADGVLTWVIPSHDCRPISCGHPGDVRHAKLLGAVFSFSNRVTYQCDPGYELIGNADLYCQSDGNWNIKTPECRIVTCEPLDNIPNGHIETEGDEYGSTARYHCERGFRLQGEAERQCGPDRLWTGDAPVCQEVTCPAPKPTGAGVTSSLSPNAGPQRLGTVVHYSCPERLVLVGSGSSTCLSVGVWSFDPPQCIPPCVVPELDNAFIEEEQASWRRTTYSKVAPGTQLTENKNLFLRCNEGYEYKGQSSTRISCHGGIWDPPQPWCTEKPCRRPPKVQNARIRDPVPHGHDLVYDCESNYRLLVSSGITPRCWLGQVQGTLPQCKQTFCKERGFPKKADQLIPQKSVFLDGEYLKYNCSDGFDSTNTKLKCVDGHWIAEDDQSFCKPKNCRLEDIPRIEDGYPEGTPNITHGSFVGYRCKENYGLSGPHGIRCFNGKWVGPHPWCVEVKKAPPRQNVGPGHHGEHALGPIQQHALELRGPNHDNGYNNAAGTAERPQLRSCKFPEREIRFHAMAGNVRVVPNSDVPHGTVLRFHCEPLGKIRLGGHESSQCQNGRWSNKVPFCYPPKKYDVVMNVIGPSETAVSPDGYLNISPGMEAEVECTSLSYAPRLEMIQATPSYRIVREYYKLNYSEARYRYHVSAKFDLHPGYEGIVRCSSDRDTQVIRIRGRHLWSCTIRADPGTTVVQRINKEISMVECRRPYVRLGKRRAVCLAYSEWLQPFPECVLPQRPSTSDQRQNTSTLPVKDALDQTTGRQRLEGPSKSACKLLEIENVVYLRTKDLISPQIYPRKELSNGTVVYFHCRGDERVAEIRCLEGLWKPSPNCPQESPAAVMRPQITEEQRLNESDRRRQGPLQARSDSKRVGPEATRTETMYPPEIMNAPPKKEISVAPDAEKEIAREPPENKQPHNLNFYRNTSTHTVLPKVTYSSSVATSKETDEIVKMASSQMETKTPYRGGQDVPNERGALPLGSKEVAAEVSVFREDLSSRLNVTTGTSTESDAVTGMKSSLNTTIDKFDKPVVSQTVATIGLASGGSQMQQRSCDLANFDARVKAFVGFQRVDNSSVQIPHNTTVQFHCEPVGRTSEATVEATCLDGQWSGNAEVPPRCDIPEGDPTVEISGTKYEVGPRAWLYVKPSRWIRLECKVKEGLSEWEVHTIHPKETTPKMFPGPVIDFEIRKDSLHVFDCHAKKSSRRRITVTGKDTRFCGNPPLAQGVKILNRTPWVLSFACDDNLLLEGAELIYCSYAGQWDKKPPRCLEPKKEPTCELNHFLNNVPKEIAIEANASEVAAGTEFDAFCKAKNLILDGHSTVVCNANGTWSFDSKMKCKHSCSHPALSQGVKVVKETRADVHFACEGDRLLVGPERINCLDNGEWDADPPVCTEPQTTPVPGCDLDQFFNAVAENIVILPNASVVAVGSVYEAMCDGNGYILDGPSSLVVCRDDGTWDFDPGMTCVKGCANFAGHQDERLIIEGVLPTYHLGDSITLTCPNGTELDPHVERITCLGEGWSEADLPHCSDTEKKSPKRRIG